MAARPMMQLQPSPAANAAFSSAAVVQISRVPSRLIVRERVASWRDAVLCRLDDLVKLPFGWDGYRAEPVRFWNVSYASRLLEAVCGDDAPEPQIVPGSSGDLQIEWHTLRGDIELHIRAPRCPRMALRFHYRAGRRGGCAGRSPSSRRSSGSDRSRHPPGCRPS